MRIFLQITIMLLAAAVSRAQDSQGGPYLIPRTVYVGDRATLVVPLPGMTSPSAKDQVITLEAPAYRFPAAADIELYKAVLERRAGGGRLLVEFSAWAPGRLELPPIEIGGERFAGLRLSIDSIIAAEGSGAALSGAALPLAIPGTGLLIYGTITALMLFLLLALWTLFWGRRRLSGWIQKWKRRRLIVSMRGVEKRLRKNLLKDGNRGDMLNLLSREFRVFLSCFSGENCRAMTAAELGRLSLRTVSAGAFAGGAERPEGAFLGPFFRRCDGLRFGGNEIADDALAAILGDLRQFLAELEQAERRKRGREEEAA